MLPQKRLTQRTSENAKMIGVPAFPLNRFGSKLGTLEMLNRESVYDADTKNRPEESERQDFCPAFQIIPTKSLSFEFPAQAFNPDECETKQSES